MDLERVIAALAPRDVVGRAPLDVADLAYDTRAVTPGALFFCVRGANVDGHELAPQAVAAGSVALVVERPLSPQVPQLVVADSRAAMATAADVFFGHPTHELEVAGVTGTNGKTTTAHLVYSILAAAGRRPGLLGTIEARVAGERRPVVRTTPEAIDLQRTFREMLDAGDRSCAMEASSHATALHRLDRVRFAALVFTNLTPEHLDFHGTMERYYDAKRRLIVENALGAVAAARILGIDDAVVARGLEAVRGVPGRFESVDEGQPFEVVVDYSHTPDSLENALRAARDLAATGRVLCVFGCGGDRDRDKRPLMGRVASELADVPILTTDNPRSEDPLAIIGEVLTGVSGEVEVEPDRRAAIARAVEAAREGDVVLVAGRGAEPAQEVAGRMLPFDDRDVAREALRRLQAVA